MDICTLTIAAFRPDSVQVRNLDKNLNKQMERMTTRPMGGAQEADD